MYDFKNTAHTADTTETKSDNKEQSVAALNTLINLALQVANTQQAQVQNAANVLAQALELGPANDCDYRLIDLEPYIYRPHQFFRLPSREDAAVACKTPEGEKEFSGGNSSV